MKFDRSNKFALCYYGQVNSLRLKSSIASKWASEYLLGYYLFCCWLYLLHEWEEITYKTVHGSQETPSTTVSRNKSITIGPISVKIASFIKRKPLLIPIKPRAATLPVWGPSLLTKHNQIHKMKDISRPLKRPSTVISLQVSIKLNCSIYRVQNKHSYFFHDFVCLL